MRHEQAAPSDVVARVVEAEIRGPIQDDFVGAWTDLLVQTHQPSRFVDPNQRRAVACDSVGARCRSGRGEAQCLERLRAHDADLREAVLALKRAYGRDGAASPSAIEVTWIEAFCFECGL